MTKSITVRAHANIALIKYWGKRDPALNIPATGSLSMTLREFHTTTQIQKSDHPRDEIYLNGPIAQEPIFRRTVHFLDFLRLKSGFMDHLKIDSVNNFPTGSGLASSASGFAALTYGFAQFHNLKLDQKELARWARVGSGSAPRSLFGGYVEMVLPRKATEEGYARQLAPADYWDLRLVVAVNQNLQKKIGSSEGMEITRKTSGYYKEWVWLNQRYLKEAKQALKQKDFQKLGELAEKSCFAMHAAMLASHPPLLYWNANTIDLILLVFEMRTAGIPCYLTIDAGPHVKVLTLPSYANEVKNKLLNSGCVQNVVINKLGPDPAIIPDFGGRDYIR